MKKKSIWLLAILLALLLVAVGCGGTDGPEEQPGDGGSQGEQGEQGEGGEGTGSEDVGQGGATGGEGEGDEGGEMHGAFTVTLVFDAGRGTVILSPAAEDNVYEEGTSVTVTVSPLPGRIVSSFEVGGEEKPLTDGQFTFTVEENVTVEAVFATVPMPEALLSCLKGRAAFSGESILADGTPSPTQLAAFDGELALHILEDQTGFICNAYRNVGGKATSYVRRADGGVETVETGMDFAFFGAPFDGLDPEGFIATGEGEYTLLNAEKAARAARALSGATGVSSFIVIASENGAISLKFESSAASYTFTSIEPMALDSYFEPLAAQPEHAALRAALHSAVTAESFRFHVKESVEFDFYVTENAVFHDGEGKKCGYLLDIDGIVHSLTYAEEDGTLTVGDPIEVTTDGEHFVTTSDIGAFKPDFAGFVAQLFAPKDGIYVIRPEARTLLSDIANRILRSVGQVAAGAVRDIEIRTENGFFTEIVITMTGGRESYVITYTGWNETELPYPVAQHDEPFVPTGVYPETFYGVFRGSDWQGLDYLVEITEEAVSVSVNGRDGTVIYRGYDSETGLRITVNGANYVLSAAEFDSDGTVTAIRLTDTETLIAFDLFRVTEGNVSLENFFGTYEGEGVWEEELRHFSIHIDENGILATANGEDVEIVITGSDGEFVRLTWNGRACLLSRNTDPDGAVLSVSLLAPDYSVLLTLPVKSAEAGQPFLGGEKFYGTYEGTYTPSGADVGVFYRVTVSKNGIYVTVDGIAAQVTDARYNEETEEFTFLADGVEYILAAHSDDAPVSTVVLWFGIINCVYLDRI